ncbi:glucosaminidase domain-containing protein [Paenibacillus sp. SI8]|uniref:glucosaminidase domain-containing protein n=1 Tax=unclassified Paenibacillus TaxID=185978 RepID=UPI00346598E9
MKPQDFFEVYTPIVMKEYQATPREKRVLCSITLSQMVEETEWGESRLFIEKNNAFGIKDSSDGKWTTREFINGIWIKIQDGFKSFASVYDSVMYHTDLINRLSLYKGIPGNEDPEDVARRLTGTWATNPMYGNNLLDICHKYSLFSVDELVKKGGDIMELVDYQWTMLDEIIGSYYNEGIITEWAWVEKVRSKNLTQSESIFLQWVLLRSMVAGRSE